MVPLWSQQSTLVRALEERSATLRELEMSLRPVRVFRRLQLHRPLGLQSVITVNKENAQNSSRSV